MTDARQSELVWEIVRGMLAAYCANDLNATLSYFANSPDLVCIGSGPQEKSIGYKGLRAGLKRDLDDSSDMTVEHPWKKVTIRGDTAWVAADALFNVDEDGDTMHVQARLTAVLVREPEGWRIIQSHLSLPYPADEA